MAPSASSPEAQRDLLLAAVTAGDWKPGNNIWPAVATKLGGGLTPGAVSQRFYKLKRAGVANGGPIAPASPAKPRAPRNTNANGNGKRKRDAAAAATEEQGGLSDGISIRSGTESTSAEEGHPPKKFKTERMANSLPSTSRAVKEAVVGSKENGDSVDDKFPINPTVAATDAVEASPKVTQEAAILSSTVYVPPSATTFILSSPPSITGTPSKYNVLPPPFARAVEAPAFPLSPPLPATSIPIGQAEALALENSTDNEVYDLTNPMTADEAVALFDVIASDNEDGKENAAREHVKEEDDASGEDKA